jgi:hypothetical protein
VDALPEPPQELYAPDAPEVSALKDGHFPRKPETIVSLNQKLARDKARALKGQWGSARSQRALQRKVVALRDRVEAILGGFPEGRPRAEVTGVMTDGGVAVERLLLRPEKGQVATGVLFSPADAAGGLDVVVSISEDDPFVARHEALTQRLVEARRSRMLFNPRGMGETAGDEHILVTDSIMLGRPYFGQRVFDALQMARYLRTRKKLPGQSITYHGRRVGALLALYACALDPDAAGAVLEEPLASYELAFTNAQPWPISIFVPRILDVTDVPYLAAACAGKRLLVVGALDGDMKRLKREQAEKVFAPAARAFDVAGGRFELKCRGSASESVAW